MLDVYSRPVAQPERLPEQQPGLRMLTAERPTPTCASTAAGSRPPPSDACPGDPGNDMAQGSATILGRSLTPTIRCIDAAEQMLSASGNIRQAQALTVAQVTALYEMLHCHELGKWEGILRILATLSVWGAGKVTFAMSRCVTSCVEGAPGGERGIHLREPLHACCSSCQSSYQRAARATDHGHMLPRRPSRR